MAIRRIDKGNPALAGSKVSKKGGASQGVSGENFASFLDSVAGTQGTQAIAGVDQVDAVGDQPSRHQRREQIEQTEELLESLKALESDLDPTQGGAAQVRERLRESRDQALRTLTNSPAEGEERELLHRTAVLASVELAKTDRGDYGS